jgi:hypothetical protein
MVSSYKSKQRADTTRVGDAGGSIVIVLKLPIRYILMPFGIILDCIKQAHKFVGATKKVAPTTETTPI